ncbi:MAG: glycerophosphodiester phosphodiesterase family protein, partial [Priestia megaterium]
ANTLTKPYVQKARSYDLDVHPYTVNDEKQMRMLIEWGVTGMFTNYPDRLYNVLHNK